MKSSCPSMHAAAFVAATSASSVVAQSLISMRTTMRTKHLSQTAFAISAMALALSLSVFHGQAYAQQVSTTVQSKVTIVKGVSPSATRRRLEEDLQARAVRELLETSFSIKITPQVEAKIPELVGLLGSAVEVSMNPPDGEVLSGTAKLTVASARLKEILTAKGIGAGDIAARSAKILISIDEYIGVATTNNAQTATQVEVNYSHDKSRFSDTSSSAAGSRSQASSSSSSEKRDVAMSASQSSAVASRESAAYAARQDTAVAGRRDTAVAMQDRSGSAAGASSSQYAGAQSTQAAGARSSELAASRSSSAAMADRSQSASASAQSSAASFSNSQNNVQQQNDKVSYSVRTKMPEFANAKPLAGNERLIAAKLGSVFNDNGLVLVSESDLRAEGGRILPVAEIVNNARVDQFVDKIRQKKMEADAWARGTASYTIVGTTASGTQCNGTLDLEIQMLESKQSNPEVIRADASGNGDQDCRARLGMAMATQLAQKLGERVVKALNATAARGKVYTLYLYSASSLGRADRNKFQTVLRGTEGLQASEPRSENNYMVLSVQMAGSLDATINKVLDALNWDKADYVSREGDRICIGLEGKQVCPADLR